MECELGLGLGAQQRKTDLTLKTDGLSVTPLLLLMSVVEARQVLGRILMLPRPDHWSRTPIIDGVCAKLATELKPYSFPDLFDAPMRPFQAIDPILWFAQWAP